MRHPSDSGAPSGAARWAPLGAALLLPALLLGPALLPGYVLSYDMVWVPDLALRSDFLGAGSALPRAVPSDAVVAVLDELVPGQLLQKLALYGALVGVGLGAARLVENRPAARLAAVTWAVWSPFVVERLGIGHWPLLWGYAAVLWMVGSCRRAALEDRVPLAAYAWIPLGSLSPSAGIATAVVVAVVGRGRTRWRMLGLAVAANLPWVVAGSWHAGAARQVAGSGQFALGGEGSVPPWLAALSLGGIWNVDVVPTTRLGFGGWFALVATVTLVIIGATARLRDGRGLDRPLVALWLLGYAAAVLTWAAPGLVAWSASTVPGTGVLRDGARALVLCTPFLVVMVGSATVWLTERMPTPTARVGVALAVVLAPLALLPSAGGGLGGRLRPVEFPASWADARVSVAEQSNGGRMLVLPFSSYRAPQWNRGRPVLDPLGRFLTPNFVVDDTLVVDGAVVPGEDPDAAAVRSALALPTAERRAAALRELGIDLVVRDRSATGAGVAPYDVSIAGPITAIGESLEVVRLGSASSVATPATAVVALAVAWTGWAAVVSAGGVAVIAEIVRRRHGKSSRHEGPQKS